MATFKAKYYDGKSPEAYAAQVELAPAALHISYQTPEQPVPLTLYWQVHRLAPETPNNSGKTILRYGTYPGQMLEITEPGFLTVFNSYYAPGPAVPPPLAPIPARRNRGLGFIIFLLLGLLALIPVGYFWLLPTVADMAARRLPMRYEQKLGRVLADRLLATEKIDQPKTANLRGFVRQLKLKQPAGLHFVVVQNPVPNAFALPGGTIVVHDAMLPLVKSPEELAALLGHEYGHIVLRHSLRALLRSLSGYILISAVFGDVSAITAVVLQNAHAFKSLAYSRAFEKEADELGFNLLLDNKLNPNGMVQLFQHLQEQKRGQNPENEYLSSHPLLSSRISNVRNLIKQKPHQVIPNDSLRYYFRRLKP